MNTKFVALCELMLLLYFDLPIRNAMVVFLLRFFASSSSSSTILLDVAYAPEGDFTIHRTACQVAKLRNREQIHDVLRMHILDGFTFRLKSQAKPMDVTIDAGSKDFIYWLAIPFDYKKMQK